ncbi:hypothetical protein [Streptomyces coeruleorubidus]|uniref:hypothetical protein n=1 Tax=Streptomyces coeruleorubidus TaxID=116188 RepID=UPI0036519D0E
MELSAQAGPGVEKAAEQAVESACHLADLAGPDGWSTAAVEDVLDAIDTLTDTLGSVGEDLAQALAAVATATAQARRRLGITVDDQGARAGQRGVGTCGGWPGAKAAQASRARSRLPGHPYGRLSA